MTLTLYHRVLSELPQLQASTTVNEHQQVEDILYKKSPASEHTKRIYQHYKDLKCGYGLTIELINL